jgi:hypothetical protein
MHEGEVSGWYGKLGIGNHVTTDMETHSLKKAITVTQEAVL